MPLCPGGPVSHVGCPVVQRLAKLPPGAALAILCLFPKPDWRRPPGGSATGTLGDDHLPSNFIDDERRASVHLANIYFLQALAVTNGDTKINENVVLSPRSSCKTRTMIR